MAASRRTWAHDVVRQGPQASARPTTSTTASRAASTWKWPMARNVPTTELRTHSTSTFRVGRPNTVDVDGWPTADHAT